jgi:hypothetical protein
LNVRPMAMASPTLFICVVSVGSACGMVAVRKHLEGKARNLGDDVINARLEARLFKAPFLQVDEQNFPHGENGYSQSQLSASRAAVLQTQCEHFRTQQE